MLKVDEEDANHRPLFLRYVDRHPRLADLTAANHFDVDMPDLESVTDFRDIPVPAVQQVLDTQLLPTQVRDWLLAMMGRAMFDVRERDAWRKVMWLVGRSNTGKSTLLDHVVKKLYQQQDVGILE